MVSLASVMLLKVKKKKKDPHPKVPSDSLFNPMLPTVPEKHWVGGVVF